MIPHFLFEYYTFLHHSQTHFRYIPENVGLNTIRFYIILKPWVKIKGEQGGLNTIRFYIILKLATVLLSLDWVEYYTFLHHSQTSNLKMKRLIHTKPIVFKLY